VPLEVRAALLGHRLRGAPGDSLGSEAMTARYSHGGYGWNQQLRQAVTLLQTALLSYGLSYGQPAWKRIYCGAVRRGSKLNW